MPAVSEINPAGLPEVVWFKRDLRVEDHTALAHATAAGPVLCVYAVELDYWRQPGTSLAPAIDSGSSCANVC